MFDVSLSQSRSRLCNGVSRRNFLRIGALAPMGLSLPGLLAAEKSAAEKSVIESVASKTRAKSVILVFLGGGISHHDSFDMKPDAVEEIRGKYKPIASNVAGTELMHRIGFAVQRGYTRMYLGANPVPGKPAQIFSTSGAEKG
mgnify:CR=1 FL=1